MASTAVTLGANLRLAVAPRWKRSVLAAWDASAWAAAVAVADLARLDLVPRLPDLRPLATMVVVAAVCQLAVGSLGGLYRGRWRVGSFEEAVGLARAAVGVAVLLILVDLVAGRLVPLSVPGIAAPIALTLTMSCRCAIRAELARRRRPAGTGASRLLVFGAGEGGADVVRTMLRDPASPYLPVALLDDDRHKRHLSLSGVPVVGTRADLASAAARHDARCVLIAIPSAPARLIREVTDEARRVGLDVKVLPAWHEVVRGSARPGEIRSPTIADLLGRREVRTDLVAAADYLAHKRVLVTGAGGSIGSELCRQIARFCPAELIMLDRDESALHALQMSLQGRASLDSPDIALVDIRDRPALDALFAARRPQVVFHAAALKHVTALEAHPGEAVKTNVWGTAHVLAAAAAHGVERLVNISTDKAADPRNVLGQSKRIAERLTAAVARSSGRTYVSVRFGNVLGSRGSVLETFRAQIAAGGPVTVTDPDVTRYFMTVEEAVELVIQAGAIGEPGEVLVLDMGEPVRIVDLARRLIDEAGRQVPLEVTGLRPGEKLHEDLFGAEEPRDHRPRHLQVSQAEVPVLHPARVWGIDPYSDPHTVVAALGAMSAAPGLRAGESVEVIDLDAAATCSTPWSHEPGPARSAVDLPAGPGIGPVERRRRSGDLVAVPEGAVSPAL